MSSNKIKLNTYVPKADSRILIDTNILLKLFYPIDIKGSAEQYVDLFSRIKSAKSQMIVSSIQVSEMINKCIRICFSLYMDKIDNHSLDFKKDYRGTEDYCTNMNAILSIVESDIVSDFVFISDGFQDMQQKEIFKYGFSYDFNDAMLVQIANTYNAVIVTDDSDFANYKTKMPIVTANRTLLMFE